MLRQLRRLAHPRCGSVTFADLQTLRAFAAAPSGQMTLIKDLRERSGAPISEVKAALQLADWDMGTHQSS
jgi:hypothetical protein